MLHLGNSYVGITPKLNSGVMELFGLDTNGKKVCNGSRVGLTSTSMS
ncbi:hypothetical protein LINGRAPRIM_LOCUS577 [Linum grandiflorum]